MSLGTVLLMKVFPALLPPVNEEDRDFYEVLGVSKNATVEEVRKAYKTKSLSLHPDKLAQRGETNVEEAAKEYQLVQEAHTVLTETENRLLYHAVKFSPTRYRFLSGEGGMGNQMAVLENLNRASFADKTKLVVFFSIFPALLLLQPLLLAIKVNQVLAQNGGGLQDAEWTLILIPWWIFHGLVVAFCITVSILSPPETRLYEAAVEQVLWFLAELFLALHWDGIYLPMSPYSVVFIPVYLALVVRWFRYGSTLNRYNDDMRRMVSEHHFRTVILQGRELDELEEAEMIELNKKYIVVTHIPPDIEVDLATPGSETADLTDEEKEEVRVASSREFEAAVELYHQTRVSMVQSIVIWTIFVILLVLKVDGHINASWWVVFLPIWIFFGAKFFATCFQCCCAPAPMEEHEMIILAAAAKHQQAKEREEKEKEKKKEHNGEGEGEGRDDNEEKKAEAAAVDATTNVASVESRDKADSGITTAQASPADSLPIKIQNDAVDNHDHELVLDSQPSKQDDADGKSTSGHKTGDNKQDSEDDKNGGAAGDGEDVEDIPTIELDEETFRAFKAAHAEATHRAMETRMRACQTSLFVCFQIIMICLVVAKLNTAFEATETREEEGPDAVVDVGFNTIWLLTPLFLIVGFMICCCAFLVYNAPNPEDLMHARDDDDNDNSNNNDTEGNNQGGGSTETGGGEPVILTPPPPPPMTTTGDEEQGGNVVKKDETAADTEVIAQNSFGEGKTAADSTPPEPPKPEINMDDLD